MKKRVITPATPAARAKAKKMGVSLEKLAPSGGRTYLKADDICFLTAKKATPTATILAEQQGVDLSRIETNQSRIYKQDVLDFLAGKTPLETEKMTPIRKITAQRMSKAQREVPMVTLHHKVDATGFLEHRRVNNQDGRVHLTINDYILYATAQMIANNPRATAQYVDEDHLLPTSGCNIGVAVSLENGLVVPVLHQADLYSLAELSAKGKELADKARQGKLEPTDITGGSLTVSNLGMMGVASFTPIINQPESMILGVGATENRLTLTDDGRVYNRQQMELSLTFDHRVHDGGGAANYLAQIVRMLEEYNKEGAGE